MKILVLNSGSSSLKYQLIDMETEEVLAKYPDENDLQAFIGHEVKNLSVQLAPYKRPVNIVVRKESFPRTATRKVKRNVVKEQTMAVVR